MILLQSTIGPHNEVLQDLLQPHFAHPQNKFLAVCLQSIGYRYDANRDHQPQQAI